MVTLLFEKLIKQWENKMQKAISLLTMVWDRIGLIGVVELEKQPLNVLSGKSGLMGTLILFPANRASQDWLLNPRTTLMTTKRY